MSGKPKTQTTVAQKNEDPWAPAQPALQTELAGATAAYGSGVGSQVYGGQRVAGLGDTSQAALDWMTANANAGQGAAKAGDAFVTGLLGNGGSTSGIQAALSGLDSVGKIDNSRVMGLADSMADPNNLAYGVARGLARGDYNLDTKGYDALGAGIAGQTQSERSLQDAADGKFLGGANPYMDAVIGRSQGEAASQIAQRFGAAGRTGSGRYAATIADSLGAIGTQARYTDYDNERTRQMQAAAQIDSARDARTGVQKSLLDGANSARLSNAGLATQGAGLWNDTNTAALGGANALAAIDGQNIANAMQSSTIKLSAAQADRAAALQGLGMVGGVIDNLQRPGQTLAQAGAIQDADRQQQLDAAREVFDEQQAAPWKQLGLYSQVVNPIAGMGGSSVGTEVKKIPQPSTLQQLAGLTVAMTGALSGKGK